MDQITCAEASGLKATIDNHAVGAMTPLVRLARASSRENSDRVVLRIPHKAPMDPINGQGDGEDDKTGRSSATPKAKKSR